jgi:hypothetical protein
MTLSSCDDAPAVTFAMPDTRMVPIHDGRFHLDDVPACPMFVSTSVNGRSLAAEVKVPAGGEAPLSLDATPPKPVVVTGRVLDAHGRPHGGGSIRAITEDSSAAAGVLSSDGSYRIETVAGADLLVISDEGEASGEVPMDAQGTYSIDLTIEPDGDRDQPAPPPDDPSPAVPDQNGPP